MVTLATYLPFYRIHEINEYFENNINIIKPDKAIVYIDNIYKENQKEILKRILPDHIEVRTGNWRNRNDTWIAMLKDFHTLSGDFIVVDSDNVVDSTFPKIHEKLRSNPIYTILDFEAWERNPGHFLARSRKIGDIDLDGKTRPLYAYKVFDSSIGGIFRGGSLFFIGPKQVVAFSKLPDLDLVTRVERALSAVDPWLRNFISDETLLGVLAYLMGIEEVPWTIASHHHHHGSTLGSATKILVASAHYQFSKGLLRELKNNIFIRYNIKYLLSIIKNLRFLTKGGLERQ